MNQVELIGAVMKEPRIRTDIPWGNRTMEAIEFMIGGQYPAPNGGDPWTWRHAVSYITEDANAEKEKVQAGKIVYVSGSISVRTIVKKDNTPKTINEVKAGIIESTRFGSEFALHQQERGTYLCNQHILNKATIIGTLDEPLDHGSEDATNHPTIARLSVPERNTRKPHNNMIAGKTWEEAVIKQIHEAEQGDLLRISGMLLDSYRKDEDTGVEKFEIYIRMSEGMRL